MRAVIWSRVSTLEQETANQLVALNRELERRGLTLVRTWQVEASAWSGNHRTERQQLIELCQRHQTDYVLVWAIDRLSREGIEDTLATVRSICASGVTLVSLQEPWVEQTGPMRDLLLAIMGWVAEQESNRRSARGKASVERRRLEGKPVGRQPGAKDKGPRKRSGYFARYERARGRPNKA